jgi:hypothetical protein
MPNLRRSPRLVDHYAYLPTTKIVEKQTSPTVPPPLASAAAPPPLASAAASSVAVAKPDPPRLLHHYLSMIQRLKDPRAIAEIVIKLFEYVLDNYDKIECYCNTDEMKNTIASLQEMVVLTPDISLCKKIEVIALVENITKIMHSHN